MRTVLNLLILSLILFSCAENHLGCANVDCQGICNGDAVIDDCGVCGGDNNCDCPDGTQMDCEGVCGGLAEIDDCGVCNGDNSSCTDNFGTSLTLDIITWNIQNFPKENNTTVYKVADIINQLGVEIIALQEIESDGYFNNLIGQLDGWSGFKSNSASYDIDLAILYDTEEITMITEYEIFENDWYAFPRSPLVFHCVWDGNEIILINNHLKALSGAENEDRRKDACEKLENYIQTNHPNDEVIILGDMNDELTDPNSSNVFLSFINNDENYQFADVSIATGSSSNWSYPTWPSHLDHILITNELFTAFDQPYSLCQTIIVEDYLQGGWQEYENDISDHRPVGIRLEF